MSQRLSERLPDLLQDVIDEMGEPALKQLLLYLPGAARRV